MTIKSWVTQNIVGILNFLVALAGFLGIGKIAKDIRKNQNVTLTNSNGNFILQAHRDFNLRNFESLLQENVTYREYGENHDSSKDLLQNILDAIDEDKNASTIAQMCLRLANKIEMNNDVRWLEKEVYGYDFGQDPEEKESISIQDTSGNEYKDYRRIKVSLVIELKGGKIEKLDPFNFFVGQPLSYIERLVQKVSQEDIILQAPPVDIMIEHLGVKPNERVPYRTKKSRLEGILDGAKREFHDFAMRAQTKINTSEE